MANRYQIIRPLGRVGMGTLYLTRDMRFEHRYVALEKNGARRATIETEEMAEMKAVGEENHHHRQIHHHRHTNARFTY